MLMILFPGKHRTNWGLLNRGNRIWGFRWRKFFWKWRLQFSKFTFSSLHFFPSRNRLPPKMNLLIYPSVLNEVTADFKLSNECYAKFCHKILCCIYLVWKNWGFTKTSKLDLFRLNIKGKSLFVLGVPNEGGEPPVCLWS